MLCLVTVLAYLPALSAGFVYDDEVSLLGNPSVTGGLGWEGLRWAWTAFAAGNWYPLTWISHMLDAELFGMAAPAHHATNVVLHAANAALLFCVLHVATGAVWRSLLGAFLFAIHPVHVESVAWISERKDVLSTFFFLLALLTWWRYARRPGARRYVPVLASFTLGLLSKPMVVTLPVVLLLMDWWPLGRLRVRGGLLGGLKVTIGALSEKVPLLALSVVLSIVTFAAQRVGGAVGSLQEYPFGIRACNALLSYVRYLGKMVFPTNLAVFYPYPEPGEAFPARSVLLSLSVVAGLTLLVLVSARRAPYLAVGWTWYLVTLVPVIDLVQVGAQSMADRYTYIPAIGYSIIASWGLAALATRNRRAVPATVAATGTALIALGAATWAQTGHWRDAGTLFGHAIAATRDNWLAHLNYGQWLAKQGRADEASREFRATVELRPTFPEGHRELAVALKELGRHEEAVVHLGEALRLGVKSPEDQGALAGLLGELGRFEESLPHYAKAARAMPRDPRTLVNYGVALARTRRMGAAVERYREALRLRPDMPEAHLNLGNALSDMGRDAEAVEHFELALRLRRDYVEAYFNLGLTHERLGRTPQAREAYRRALAIAPAFSPARSGLQRLPD